jgi:two-component system response regulator HydG
VPPLRERMEDIQLLTDHFLKLYAEKYQRRIAGVSQSAYQRLFGHPWPGNVRELQNVIERAVLLAKGERIEPLDLPFDNGGPAGSATTARSWDIPPNMTLEDIEKVVIERTLQRTGGNKQKAANLLGIYRPRLYSKIKKYKIGIETISQN